LRYLFLDTIDNNGRAPQSANPLLQPAIDPSITTTDTHRRDEDQFCVPSVNLKGDSYRLKGRDLGRVPDPDHTPNA
jgi:hypothetical protein